MGLFARAVITGFGFTLGAALFRKLSKQLGFEDPLYAQQPRASEAAPPATNN